MKNDNSSKRGTMFRAIFYLHIVLLDALSYNDCMPIILHILEQSGRLSAFTDTIQHAFDRAVINIKHKLPSLNVDVVITDNPDATIPETGVGGFAPTAHVLYVSINPAFEGLWNSLNAEIQSTLAHELHHCARWQAVGYGTTLLEALVSEGLADHFDIEVNGTQPRPWSVALQDTELEQMKEKAKPFLHDARYSHNDWFFGSKELNIPRWTGYALGFDVVGTYMQRAGKTASELVAMHADAFM